MTDLVFHVSKESYNKVINYGRNNSTLGCYDFKTQKVHVHLANSWDSSKFRYTRDPTKDQVDYLIDSICNTVQHETLHSAIWDVLGEDAFKLDLPLTRQEQMVRKVMEDRNEENLVNYILNDVVITVAKSTAIDKFITNKRIEMMQVYVVFLFFCYSLAYLNILKAPSFGTGLIFLISQLLSMIIIFFFHRSKT